MRIPSPTTTTPVATVATSQPAAPAARPQGLQLDKAQGDNAARAVPVLASTTVSLQGLPRQPAAAGVSAGGLASMLQTAMKMNAIRNDPDMPESMKKALLQPLQQASKAMLEAVDAKAELEEKAEMTEAATDEAQAIRQTGEDIAAARATGDSAAPEAGDGVPAPNGATAGDLKRAGQAAPGAQAPAEAAEPEGRASVYAVSPPPPAPGKTIDTHA